MKKNVFAIFFFFCLNLGFAQDQLFKMDNTKLLVKLIEVGTDQISYKLFENLKGPTYIINKTDVKLLVFENGKQLVIENESQTNQTRTPISSKKLLFRKDSARYFKYSQSISLNFINFLNSEVGLIYQKEFFKKKWNAQLSFALGFDAPTNTQIEYYAYNDNNLILNRKTFEVGLASNYYFSLRKKSNYYLGAGFSLMQYDVTQSIRSYENGKYGTYKYIEQNSILTSYHATITNGFMFRTKSRILFNLFCSIGLKYDMLSDIIFDPVSHQEVVLISSPVQLLISTGACIGFAF